MQIHAHPIALALETPFKIAHGTSLTRDNVIVTIDDGVGVAAITPYYPAQVPDVLDYVQQPELQAVLQQDIRHVDHLISQLPPGPAPARAAVDMALHDLWARTLDQPLYALWGLNPATAPLSSYTLGMAESEEAFQDKVLAARHYPILKIKLGTGSVDGDYRLVEIAARHTDARLCVDANAAWTVDDAARIIPELTRFNLLFVEQPLAQHDIEGWHALGARLPAEHPPLIADESIHDSRDILPLHGAADGINIKLAKCGGLREARKMIAHARALNMVVMLGCMVESVVGVTAAAHLAPLVDFADLDGFLTVTNDPYTGGAQWHNGKLILPDAPGLGVTPRLQQQR
ncbi:MAG: dipeptide epimerase [Anaerolineae bacterium]